MKSTIIVDKNHACLCRLESDVCWIPLNNGDIVYDKKGFPHIIIRKEFDIPTNELMLVTEKTDDDYERNM